ncbi:ribosome silencing factor [bacterium]|nr:ribosome silencing factor [bacterium]
MHHLCYNKDILSKVTTKQKQSVLSPDLKSKKVLQIASNQKALDLKVFNVQGHSAYADFFVVMSATSTTHAQGLADAILKQFPKGSQHLEGYQNGQWILLDVGDVVVHIFLEEAREHYNFDKLWGHVPYEKVHDAALLTAH